MLGAEICEIQRVKERSDSIIKGVEKWGLKKEFSSSWKDSRACADAPARLSEKTAPH
jgi:hypothetical protein